MRRQLRDPRPDRFNVDHPGTLRLPLPQENPSPATAAAKPIHLSADEPLVVGEEGGAQRVYTLQTADRPYRVLIEEIHEGAVTLNEEGTILYCNRALADLLRTPLERVIGAQLSDFVPYEGRS